jgi:hypothetical protein
MSASSLVFILFHIFSFHFSPYFDFFLFSVTCLLSSTWFHLPLKFLCTFIIFHNFDLCFCTSLLSLCDFTSFPGTFHIVLWFLSCQLFHFHFYFAFSIPRFGYYPCLHCVYSNKFCGPKSKCQQHLLMSVVTKHSGTCIGFSSNYKLH